MTRTVTAELLDELSPTDPAALRSRRDLRRVNAVLGHHRLLARALRAAWPRARRPRLLDLATGDGTQVLRLARTLGHLPGGGELTLLDRQDIVSEGTRARLGDLGWSVTIEHADVRAWIGRTVEPGFDAIVTNLFLHHLPDGELSAVLEALARRTRVFAAVEPRRGALPLAQSRLVGLLGCNHVTRRDAVASVRAGFAGLELSQRWPPDPAWHLHERPAGLASHVFVARRRAPG
jgi:hypothetical protein